MTEPTHDLDEAIHLDREALALHPPGHADRSDSLNKLAIHLWSRFEGTRQMQDLEEAIEIDREALSLRPFGHSGRSNSLFNLAIDLRSRFKQTGQLQDLEAAIELDRESLSLRPPGHSVRFNSLSNVAIDLRFRFEQTGHLQDLDEAIELDREALSLRPPGDPNRFFSLNNLAQGLWSRFEQTGQLQDLAASVELYREALSLQPPGHANRSDALNNLARGLRSRFEQTGQLQYLEEAIRLNREALSLRPPGHPVRLHSLSNVAINLRSRFEQTGRLQDLEEAIELHREALSLQPPGRSDRSLYLNNLANCLLSRFEQTGLQDLEEAIELNREALSLRPPGQPNRFLYLNNLAYGLHFHFKQTGQLQNLEEAIELNYEALSLRPLDHPRRPASLINLGETLYSRFKRTEQRHNLEEAIELYREALSLLPFGHPHCPDSLSNLGESLHSRFMQTGQLQDIDKAIEYYREALAICRAGSPLYIPCLAGLSRALLARFRAIPREDDLNEAFYMFSTATESRFTDVGQQLLGAQSWVQSAREFQHSSLLSAYVQCLALLQRGLAISPSLELQWKSLTRNSSSLAVDAASSAIDKGQLNVAVEMLEQGRALLWSRMKGYRQPVLELRAINPALADKFETVSNELEHLATSRLRLEDDVSGRVPRFTTAWDDQWKKQRVLSDEWNEIVGRIRQIEGFSDFLQPVPFGRLKQAAAEGPVIIVNVSSYRSDALVLRDDTSDPTLVPLANSVFDEVGKLSEVLGQARRRGEDTLAAVIHDVLCALWKLVAQPVVDQLQSLGVAERSRIWWCPTGKLCSLPLHAAHPLITGERGLPDLFVSSYTPTLSSLISARENIPAMRSKYPQLLTVGRADDSLRCVDAELDGIQELGDFVDTIVEKQATPDAVLDNLQTHPWAHFACHGHLDDEQPFKSSFKLYGGSRLTVMDILQSRLPNAEFAFLSACHSAAGDYVHTPDEVLHIAAAMQFCGFRGVVGTLWGMADDDGPVLSQEFYKHMFRHDDPTKVDYKDSAVALRSGIKALRKSGVPLHRWAAFVHIGA
ncbi:hypothetical protein HETIRDRAFT_174846 [Heterobasidion irregulare TC 32-1]|uniref:CHAT domain-containing protein n=1 Tax=Heterobasidion irregulare (strain TC 32-1) TaxID=747525 RepID=W4JTF3_HETIT|nr:uncharacterized protein HETIRDRAFT_174846 [Heterobasidion irregulare TC 32-1]ETW76798.1 hypothetical protein HETIRDRAFT_174846 [Heterobasidion irregulare TC 32-1]